MTGSHLVRDWVRSLLEALYLVTLYNFASRGVITSPHLSPSLPKVPYGATCTNGICLEGSRGLRFWLGADPVGTFLTGKIKPQLIRLAAGHHPIFMHFPLQVALKLERNRQRTREGSGG